MNRTIPRIPAGPGDIGLFVAVAVSLGVIAGNPAGIYELAVGQPPPNGVTEALLPVFWFSPLVASAIVVRRLRLSGGLRTFLRERFRWHTDGRWYLVSIGLMPVLFTITYVGFIAFNQPVTVDLATVGLLLLEVLLLGIGLNLVENYGWRGFLQEALQSRFSALVAALTVGVVWGLWHASLFLHGGPFESIPVTSFFLVIIGEAVIIGWLYNSTAGSVLHATLLHTSFNASFGGFVTLLVLAGRSVDEFYAVAAVVIWLTAAVIVFRTDHSTLGGGTDPELSG